MRPQCDGCRVLVHQLCYGVATPPNGRLWLCDVCILGAPSMPLCSALLQLRFQDASASGCAPRSLAMPSGSLGLSPLVGPLVKVCCAVLENCLCLRP